MPTTRKLALIAGLAAAGTAAAVAARHTGGKARPRTGSRHTVRGVTVDRPPAQVYAFWRDLRTLATSLDRATRVRELDRRLSQWTVDGPLDIPVEWTAEITEDVAERVLGWRVEDGPVPHEGRVEFTAAPNDRGTEVRVELRYDVPGGKLGATAARLTGDEPDQVLRTTLRRMKQLLECGRVVTVDGQPTGRRAVQERVTRVLQHKLSTGGRP